MDLGGNYNYKHIDIIVNRNKFSGRCNFINFRQYGFIYNINSEFSRKLSEKRKIGNDIKFIGISILTFFIFLIILGTL